MYQVFGNEIYDTKKIEEILKSKGLNIISDLTKSLNLEDAFAFKCNVPVELIEHNCSIKNIETIFKNNNNLEEIENIFSLSDEFLNKIIEDLNIKYSSHIVKSIKYDQINNSINFIFLVMYVETARKKLNHTFKRLLRNNFE